MCRDEPILFPFACLTNRGKFFSNGGSSFPFNSGGSSKGASGAAAVHPLGEMFREYALPSLGFWTDSRRSGCRSRNAYVVCKSAYFSKSCADSVYPGEPMASDPIEHVIILMLENRSFDHMLG